MPPPTCADLMAGQIVEIGLVNDMPPLAATQVAPGQMGDVKLLGPIQMTDPNAQTLTVFGLVIDASMAVTGPHCGGGGGGGDDQGEQESESHWFHPPTPIDLTTLAVGQFVKVRLDQTKLPALVATVIDVQNTGNQMEVEVEDQDGQEVDDGSDTMSVTVDQKATLPLQTTVHGVAKIRHVHRVMHFQMKSHGSFKVNGLATGKAKILVTRNASGTTSKGKGAAAVRANQTNSVKLKLKPSKSD
jgi:hypothetical protein